MLNPARKMLDLFRAMDRWTSWAYERFGFETPRAFPLGSHRAWRGISKGQVSRVARHSGSTNVGRGGLPTVLFVGLARGAGGSTRSLTTVLSRLGSSARRVIAAPIDGRFHEIAREHAEEWLDLDSTRYTRWRAMLAVARYALENRGTITAVHANGLTAINLAAPAALIARAPLVIWVHNFELSKWSRRFAWFWRFALRDAIWAVVSPTTRKLVLEGGLTRPAQVRLVPNPIDPADYAVPRSAGNGRLRICYLAGASRRKGFDLLPAVIAGLRGQGCRWLIFSSAEPRDEGLASTLDALQEFEDPDVQVMEKVRDARDIYRQCDIVFMPSRKESFGRVAAEAMLNGIPVVASDLDALRDVLGDAEAGLLFPVGAVDAAVERLTRLVTDETLRDRLGEVGKRRAKEFEPSRVTDLLANLYGVSRTAREEAGDRDRTTWS